MSRGLKRLSAAAWLVVAVVATFRVWVRWEISPDTHTNWAFLVTVGGPILMHFLTIWIINGFAKRDHD